ncbi:hypothetical protein HMPREF9574_01221 [Cutibacterium acnes HL074PA1]|nr:hypothetical protein HMPREF9574_01221 [Cutibacterium acnes HL074PA1]
MASRLAARITCKGALGHRPGGRWAALMSSNLMPRDGTCQMNERMEPIL